MVTNAIGFSVAIALALGSTDMNHHGTCEGMRHFEGVDQFLEIVTINGTDVSKAEFFKYGSHFVLYHRHNFEIVLDAFNLRADLFAHKGNIADLPFEIVGDEFHRWAEAHFI